MKSNNKKKLLIIDDSHDILDLMEIFLYERYECYTALNGFEGIKMAKDILPDIIITDIVMPVIDGIKFLNNIKSEEKTAKIPVIALTSFTKKKNIKSLLSCGFCAVITKPFVRDSIIETIEKSLYQTKTN
jgi:CheY-like chemotaxis protein